MKREDLEAAIDGHQARNEALVRRFLELGVDVEEPHDVEFHFWSPDQQSGALLAHALYERGFLVLALAHTENEQWNVEAGARGKLREAAARETTVDLVELAARFESTYDGWGASVLPKSPS